MNFGVSDNSCMFVPFKANEQTKHIFSNGYFLWLCVSYYLHDIRLSLPVRLLQKCNGCSLARMGGDGLSLFNDFKIHLTMPTNNELEASTQGVSTSQPQKTVSRLEKEIISIQKKVSKLQEECRHERNEKYRLLCYINRYCSALFPYFDKSNPVDSKNWERVHRLQLDLDKEIK